MTAPYLQVRAILPRV